MSKLIDIFTTKQGCKVIIVDHSAPHDDDPHYEIILSGPEDEDEHD